MSNRFISRVISAVLVLAMMIIIFPIGVVPAEATSYTTSVSSANGSNYSTSPTLATKLNAVFSGDIDIYSNSACSKEVSMPIGTSMSTSTQYYVKSKITGNNVTGWQCYIYANAVYNKLFNEWVGHGTSFSNSKVVVSGGSSTVSYSMLKNAGVRCGAYVRTTDKVSGAYNGSVGHSFIILSYNSNSISYLEGNGDGKGAIRIVKQTWSEFNSSQVSGRGRYISHIVQPTNAYYDSLYGDNSSDDIISIAKNQMGSYGSDINKFSTWYYGQQKSAAWCAIFISWCANQAGVLNTAIPKQANCNNMMNWFKNRNAFYSVSSSYVPQKGDIVFFDTKGNGGANHVEFISEAGYITESGKTKIKCIGGNTSDSNFNGADYVAEKKRDINASGAKVIGFAHPSYNGVYSISTNPDDYTFPTRDLYYSSSSVMTGNDVAWVQAFLYQMGYEIEIDKSYGPTTKSVVTQFQKANGLSADGCVGPEMRPKMKAMWEAAKHTTCTWNSGTVTTPATHTATGVKTYACTYCNATKTEVIPKTTTHSYASWEYYNSTQHIHRCACSAYELADHTWNSGVVTKAATCTATGVKTYTCTGCNTTKTETIPSVSHSYGAWQKYSATQHKRTCACGASELATHSWNGGVVTKPATHTVTGEKTYACTVCSETKIESISTTSLPHSYGSWEYYNSTQHIHRCACSAYELADHTWNSGVVTKAATCTATGVKTYTCTGCNTTKTETIPSVSHSYGAWQKYSATQHKRTCACGASEFADHAWNNGVITKPATYIANGEKTYTCAVCSATKTESIPILLPTENMPQIIVSDSELIAGNTVKVQISIKNNPGIASMKLNLAFDPTVLELKEIEYNATIGGQSQLPQDYRNPVILNWFNGSANSTGDFAFATLTFEVAKNATAGSSTKIVVTYNENDIYNIKEENIAFHVSGGELTVIDYMPGDINNDGSVNNKDVTRLFQHLSNWNVEVNESALDVNGDGSVNNRDLTRLFQFVSGWDVQIH